MAERRLRSLHLSDAVSRVRFADSVYAVFLQPLREPWRVVLLTAPIAGQSSQRLLCCPVAIARALPVPQCPALPKFAGVTGTVLAKDALTGFSAPQAWHFFWIRPFPAWH